LLSEVGAMAGISHQRAKRFLQSAMNRFRKAADARCHRP
jgi:hypothetical protein